MSPNITFKSFNEIHGNRYQCNECGHQFWAGKTQNEEKHEKRPPCPTPDSLGIDYCQMCKLKKDELLYAQTLETHHSDGNPWNNDRKNLIILCTQHHKLAHHIVNHYTDPYLKKIEEWGIGRRTENRNPDPASPDNNRVSAREGTCKITSD